MNDCSLLDVCHCLLDEALKWAFIDYTGTHLNTSFFFSLYSSSIFFIYNSFLENSVGMSEEVLVPMKKKLTHFLLGYF